MQKEISEEKLKEYVRNGKYLKDIIAETGLYYRAVKKQLVNSGLEDIQFKKC